MENMNNHGPCLDKNCGYCCDPVKVNAKVKIDIPKDGHGADLWVKRDEVLIPELRVDTDRIVTYDCKNFDPITRKCLDHEGRPDICRTASCISDPHGNIDEQHKKVIETKFIPIRPYT